MAEADPSAGDPNAPREVETDAPSEQESAVRPSPVATDRGWWDETAAAVQLPPLPVLPGSPPGSSAPAASGPQPSLPALSGGRTPVDAGTYPPRPIPTLDPRPITAADLEDEARTPSIAALLGARPTSAWVSVGMVAVGVAFVFGLLLGRGKAPAAAASGSVPAVSLAPKTPAPPVTAMPSAASPNAVSVANPASSANPSAATPAPIASAAPESPATVSAPAAADAGKAATPKPALEPFNAKAARTNLSVAVARAQRCREQTAPAGSVAAVVTFVASGRVADVTVITPTYAGTRTGKCIISKLKTAQVPPFAGEPETMKKTFTLR